MKRTAKFPTITISMIFVVTVIFTACFNDTSSVTAKLIESTEKFVVIEATTTGGSLENAMSALNKAGELTYEGSESEYGFYLTSVNGYTPDVDKNEYWALYTTLGKYEGVVYSSEEYGTYDYNGKTCASTTYGISGIIMVEGNIYILAIVSY